MKKGDLIFVYGTLMKGMRADITTRSIFSVSPMGKDSVNGELFHLGGFPGLKLFDDLQGEADDSRPLVKGEVYLIQDPSMTALLDAYEGYDSDNPERGLYNRKEVFTFFGRKVWVYTYNGPTRNDQLIETGDWRNPRLVVTRRVPVTG